VGRKPHILIDADMTGELLVDTLIHEMLHICLPDIKEEAVTATATSLARGLLKLLPQFEGATLSGGGNCGGLAPPVHAPALP
jgi:hypothetical protein